MRLFNSVDQSNSIVERLGLWCLTGLVAWGWMFCLATPVTGQQTNNRDGLRFGLAVPPEVDQITSRALSFLAQTQTPEGNWLKGYDGHSKGRETPGVTGLALMAMLSTGSDPNSGPDAANIRAAIRYIIGTQNIETGFLRNTMYNHGFATLALSEAYGVVDESLLWTDADTEIEASNRRPIGEVLKSAVACALNSQNQNPNKAWRYQPSSKDADTSVTGAVLVGLLAARNAGINVPQKNIDDALEYMKTLTNRRNGETGYSISTAHVTLGSNLSAISALVMAVGQKQQWKHYQAASKQVASFIDQVDEQYPFYNMYYMAQALFQSDYDSWKRWNAITIRRLRRKQQDDGSFTSNHGTAYGTSMACLSLALNYRLLPIYER